MNTNHRRGNGGGEEDAAADAQVAAFLRMLNARLGTDEETLQRIIDRQQRNGKTYVTWAAIMGIVVALATSLLVRSINQLDASIAQFDRRLTAHEEREIDTRERVRVLEERYRAAHRTPANP